MRRGRATPPAWSCRRSSRRSEWAGRTGGPRRSPSPHSPCRCGRRCPPRPRRPSRSRCPMRSPSVDIHAVGAGAAPEGEHRAVPGREGRQTRPVRAVVCRPPTTSARTWSGWFAGWARCSTRRAIGCSWSTTTRRTAPARSPDALAAELPWWRCCTGRGRRASAGRTWTPFRGPWPPAHATSLEMDCDFSHDPATSRSSSRRARRAPTSHSGRATSRRAHGQLEVVRKAISKGGPVYARAFLGVGVRDLTGGSRGFRREVLEAIDLGSVTSDGYAFRIELDLPRAAQGLPCRRSRSRLPTARRAAPR